MDAPQVANVTTTPLTAVDTFYATQFPTYDELHEFVLQDLPERAPQVRRSHMEWVAELGPNNHLLLKRIFDSRMNKDVVREVGIEINERGDMSAMGANFFIYCHFVGERLKDMGVTKGQWCEMHYNHARHIEALWDGVGQWRA